MTAVVFETPGLIDVRAFTIMGAHAKPNSANPIGYFGTGLKYAIAVLVRLGAEPVVWIGKDRLSFSSKKSTFRGSPLETIKMTVRKFGNVRSTSYELPYTTAYGKNWKVWQAFRELESNTRDEGGKTWLAPEQPGSAIIGVDGITRIVVDLQAFTEAAEKIDEIFLPRARREGKLLEAIEEGLENNFVYYRTMRAYDGGKPTIFTYNILERMTLTEDRTFAYGFQVKEVIARWALTEATETQIEAIVTAEEEWYEHNLEFPGHVAPSEAFRAVMERRPKGTSRYAHAYYHSHSGVSTRRDRSGFSLFVECPKPWRIEGDLVLDASGDAVFERPDDVGWDEWNAIAGSIIKRLDVLPIPSPAAMIGWGNAEPGRKIVPEVPAETSEEIPF